MARGDTPTGSVTAIERGATLILAASGNDQLCEPQQRVYDSLESTFGATHMAQRLFSIVFVALLTLTTCFAQRRAGTMRSEVKAPAAPQTTAVNHVFWIWFENREVTDITAATAPTFDNFANTFARLTNFFGVEHPSQPNYIDSFSGSNQGVIDDLHHTFAANGNDNLAKQLDAAGKSWRVYAQDYPGACSDLDFFTGGVDGPGVAGQYARKHNPVISFESVRLDATQCSFIQPLATFDPSVNFAFVVPNQTNDMHDGTTAQGDAFLNAFLPSITGSPDFAHTLVIVTFDEGSTNTNGGGHLYTAAGAPWLSNVTVSPTYNHFSMLRTIEQIFGLPFLGSAATATTITEILPQITTAAMVTVSGRVLSSDGNGLRNARVDLHDPAGNTRSAITNAFGHYSFESVASGVSYVVDVQARRGVFTPRLVTVTDRIVDLDFTPK
jgi:hypothetical protein